MAPAKSRPSAAPERQNRVPLALPIYEPPQHPLNAPAKRALETLPRNHRLDGLKNKQKLANIYLTQAAADINDRLQGKTTECEKFKKRRLEKQGSQEDHEEIDRTLYNMRQATDIMTDRLEENVRKIIDASAEVEGVERVLKELHANVMNPRGNGSSTQSTAAATQNNQGQRRRTDGTDDDGSDYEDGTTLAAEDSASTMEALKQKIAEQREAYQAMSMAHRYVVLVVVIYYLLTQSHLAMPPITTMWASKRLFTTHITQKIALRQCLTPLHGLRMNRTMPQALRLVVQQ